MNDVISYSEMNNIATVYLAMHDLRISEVLFSAARSALVVLVAILVVTLPRTGISHPVSQGPCDTDTNKEDTMSQSTHEEDTNKEDTMSQDAETLVSIVREAYIANPDIGYRELAESLKANPKTVRRYLTQSRKISSGIEVMVDGDDADDHQDHNSEMP